MNSALGGLALPGKMALCVDLWCPEKVASMCTYPREWVLFNAYCGLQVQHSCSRNNGFRGIVRFFIRAIVWMANNQ